MATRRPVIRWRLRQVMATRGMFATSDLVAPLADRGVVLSREQVYRLVTGTPERLNTKALAALCDILDVSVGELIEVVVGDPAGSQGRWGRQGAGWGRPGRAASHACPRRRRCRRRAPACYKIGWYADHLRPTVKPMNWKTFHIRQLILWVDANFRTLGSPTGRAVAGLSMGGYGAQKYTAEFPDQFAAVSSYSGPSNNLAPEIEGWIFATPAADGQAPGAVYGNPGEHHDVMRRENPWDNVESFRNKRIALYAGRTELTPDNFMNDVQERVVHALNAAFHQRLLDAGIPNEFHDYPGSHTGDHWTRNFREDLPGILDHLDRPTG
jgi:DNA-binding Xre family transcriptional regulator